MASNIPRQVLGSITTNKHLNTSINSYLDAFDKSIVSGSGTVSLIVSQPVKVDNQLGADNSLSSALNASQSTIYDGRITSYFLKADGTRAKPKLGFLNLPREIRDVIYKYYIRNKCRCKKEHCRDLPVTITSTHPPAIRLDDFEPALSQTCRVVRQELLPIFYTDSIFDFTVINWHIICVLESWAQLIPAEHKCLIRRLMFYLEGNEGWMNASHVLKTIDKHFAPGCGLMFSGDSEKMSSAFARSYEIAKGFRDAGVSWDETKVHLDRVAHILQASGHRETWPDDWSDMEGEEEEEEEEEAEEGGEEDESDF